MSIRSRVRKRKPDVEVIVIDDSDDSDNENTDISENTSTTTSNRRIDAAASQITNTKRSQRWPTKRKKDDNIDYCNESTNEPSTSSNANFFEEPTVSNTISAPSRRGFWNIHDLLAERENVDLTSAQNIVRLFDQDNTIPFICRYRRDLVNQISPERLREIKNTYTEIVNLRKRADNIVSQLQKDNIDDGNVQSLILSAKTNEELEFLYAPYKPTSKGSLAERAKSLGLEPYANIILNGGLTNETPQNYVNFKNSQLDSVDKVTEGVRNIISHNISKNSDVLEELRSLQKRHRIILKTKKISNKDKLAEVNSKELAKFENYFNFEHEVKTIKPHQVLAINRAEKLKFITIKIDIPDQLKSELLNFMRKKFLKLDIHQNMHFHIMQTAIDDCYAKKLKPLMVRQIRSDLNTVAKNASVEVFAKNLKQLLLMSPLKGERILGIDPGFANGCKFALISETADVLETGVIYPHKSNSDPEVIGEKLAKLLARHDCTIIGLGNGKGCRETEQWLTKLFTIGILDRNRIKYSIVSEQGASIYSCSELARREFPNKDVNEISAISIARRLNDPLSEYVKIEPRHIGVGMYQHDINDKALTESLNEIVSECVSYVGVDINTASLSVLKHVAGLSEKKAEQIIKYRMENGPFLKRTDLLKVKTIGEKTFTQCAGFIRIEPRSVNGQIGNYLDCTWVHPESYDVAEKIIKYCNLSPCDIGKPHFIKKICDLTKEADMKALMQIFKMPVERLEMLFVALQREPFRDYRSDIQNIPLFKKGITRLKDINVGDTLNGVVNNITNFGAFVDIGVECNGLLHSSAMRGFSLNIGDRIVVIIKNIEISRNRISLGLISISSGNANYI